MVSPLYSLPSPVAEPPGDADAAAVLLGGVCDDLHLLLSQQAAILVAAAAVRVHLGRDDGAAAAVLARIGEAAEASMHDIRLMLAGLEAAAVAPLAASAASPSPA